MPRGNCHASNHRRHARILTTYPVVDASRRLRIQPIAEQLAQDGYKVSIDQIFSTQAYLWKNGKRLQRACAALIVAAGLIRRLFLILFLPPTGIVLVHREAFPFFTPTFERLAVRRACVAILDIDDAIYEDVTHGRDWRRFFRDPAGALDFHSIFDLIVCGNQQLMEMYSSLGAQTIYAPTCPQRAVHQIQPNRQPIAQDVVWIGSQSTLSSLRDKLPAISEALRQTQSTMLILGGMNVFALDRDACIKVARWTADRELVALATSRVGVMPLPDTPWERGKSGFKAIMYLCSGLTAVISPIGFNKTLCSEFGAIPCPDDEWKEVLERVLTEKPACREKQLATARHAFDPDKVAKRVTTTIQELFDHKNEKAN